MDDTEVDRRTRVILHRDGLIRQPYYHIYISVDEASDEKIGIYNPMLPDDHPEMLIVRRERLAELLSGDVEMPIDLAERARRWRDHRENDRHFLGLPCA